VKKWSTDPSYGPANANWTYHVDGTRVLGAQETAWGTRMWFDYDGEGNLCGVDYASYSNGNPDLDNGYYVYRRNMQGDIVDIVRYPSNKVAHRKKVSNVRKYP